MAGESVARIKEKEREAAELVDKARLEATRIVQGARDERAAFLEEKDALLKREEAGIREAYVRESEAILRDLQAEEQKEMRRIDETCGRNLKKVVMFISKEIVKV